MQNTKIVTGNECYPNLKVYIYSLLIEHITDMNKKP